MNKNGKKSIRLNKNQELIFQGYLILLEQDKIKILKEDTLDPQDVDFYKRNLEDLGLLETFLQQGLFINSNFIVVANNSKIEKITFKSCQINISKGSSEFSCSEIEFIRCNFGKNNEFNHDSNNSLIFLEEFYPKINYSFKTRTFDLENFNKVMINNYEVESEINAKLKVQAQNVTGTFQVLKSDNHLTIGKGSSINRVELNNTVHLKFKELFYQNGTMSFDNGTKLYLKDIQNISELCIKGNVHRCGFEFENINLGNARVLINKNSQIDLDQSNSNEVTWNAQKFDYHDTNKLTPNHEDIVSAREFYNRFKNYLKKRGDSIQGQSFYAKEMETYSKLLSSSKTGWEDRISIRFSKIFSDFGQSWVKPSVYYFLIAFYFSEIILIMRLSLEYPYNFLYLDWGELLRYLFIPTELIKVRSSDIFQNSVSLSSTRGDIYLIFWFNIFLFLWKVFASYLIFQIVNAFRKYTKNL